jgi:hypothetical protein
MARSEKLVGMTPRGACGLAVQLPIQFATCASAGWHANKSADKIAASSARPHDRAGRRDIARRIEVFDVLYWHQMPTLIWLFMFVHLLIHLSLVVYLNVNFICRFDA